MSMPKKDASVGKGGRRVRRSDGVERTDEETGAAIRGPHGTLLKYLVTPLVAPNDALCVKWSSGR